MIGDVGAEIGFEDYDAVIDESIAILNGESVNGVSLLDLDPALAPVPEKKKPKRRSKSSIAPLAPVPVLVPEYEAVINQTADFLNRHPISKARRVAKPADTVPNDDGEVMEANIPIRPSKKPQKPKKVPRAKPRPRESDSILVVDEDTSLTEIHLDPEYDRPISTKEVSRKPTKTKPNTKQPRKRAKPAQPAVDEDIDEDIDDDHVARPRKRSRNTPSESRSKSPLVEQAARSSSSSDRQNPMAPARRNRPTHTLQILQLRTNDPTADGGSHVTRSGRRIVKPLAHWRGETVEHAHDGTIRHVVRAESIEVEAPARRRAKKRPTPGARPLEAIREDDDEPEPEPEDEGESLLWQREGETVRAAVRMWDPEEAVAVEDEYELGKAAPFRA
jgi:hypothetical protein